MATVGVRQQLLIGGEWRDSASGATYERRNPWSGEGAGTIAAATRDDARAAVEAAAAAFPTWSSRSAGERRQILDRAAELMMERQQDIAAIVTDETGGTFG